MRRSVDAGLAVTRGGMSMCRGVDRAARRRHRRAGAARSATASTSSRARRSLFFSTVAICLAHAPVRAGSLRRGADLCAVVARDGRPPTISSTSSTLDCARARVLCAPRAASTRRKRGSPSASSAPRRPTSSCARGRRVCAWREAAAPRPGERDGASGTRAEAVAIHDGEGRRDGRRPGARRHRRDRHRSRRDRRRRTLLTSPDGDRVPPGRDRAPRRVRAEVRQGRAHVRRRAPASGGVARPAERRLDGHAADSLDLAEHPARSPPRWTRSPRRGSRSRSLARAASGSSTATSRSRTRSRRSTR